MALKAFESGRCDAFTTDSSGLYAERIRLTNPDDYMVLPDIISKEPLAMAVRHGDNNWGDIVRWTFFALVAAEEYGVTSANVEEQASSSEQPSRPRRRRRRRSSASGTAGSASGGSANGGVDGSAAAPESVIPT